MWSSRADVRVGSLCGMLTVRIMQCGHGHTCDWVSDAWKVTRREGLRGLPGAAVLGGDPPIAAVGAKPGAARRGFGPAVSGNEWLDWYDRFTTRMQKAACALPAW